MGEAKSKHIFTKGGVFNSDLKDSVRILQSTDSLEFMDCFNSLKTLTDFNGF